jgi:hypothetical protein
MDEAKRTSIGCRITDVRGVAQNKPDVTHISLTNGLREPARKTKMKRKLLPIIFLLSILLSQSHVKLHRPAKTSNLLYPLLQTQSKK